LVCEETPFREQSFVFDASVLEPDLDLLLAEPEGRGDLNAAQAGQIDSVAERTLEFDQLTTAE